MIISFSGLDGVGKTTQINLAVQHLTELGRETQVIRMYDHVSASAWLRNSLRGLRKKKRKKSKGPAAPRPATGYRMDKNRKSGGIVLLRQLVYVADLAVFLMVKFYHETWRRKVVVCDRHLIDSIVNLSNTNRFAELYAKLFLRILPVPDVPILLDVDAEVAFERKPEYPLAYNLERREAYLSVFRRLRRGVIVKTTTIPETQRQIREQIDRAMAGARA